MFIGHEESTVSDLPPVSGPPERGQIFFCAARPKNARKKISVSKTGKITMFSQLGLNPRSFFSAYFRLFMRDHRENLIFHVKIRLFLGEKPQNFLRGPFGPSKPPIFFFTVLFFSGSVSEVSPSPPPVSGSPEFRFGYPDTCDKNPVLFRGEEFSC